MFSLVFHLIHKYGTASAVDFDATGKLGPSLVEGNRVWLGDYEACQRLNESLYCVADLSVNLSPPLQANFVRINSLRTSVVPLKNGHADGHY